MSSSPPTQPSPPAHATLTLAGSRLELRCPAANSLREDRPLTAADEANFQDWSARHLKLAKHHDAAALLVLGQEMGAWLNGKTSDLTRILEAGNVPLVLAFIIGRMDESNLARAFLDAPWELLALPGQPRHLALREDVVLTVIRRIGPAQPEVPAASAHRLNAIFMAAAPRSADNLDWEAEETAILTATQHMPLDLVVEESGTLDLLEKCVAREKPDVVQISCHGTLEPKPGLYLEDDVGDVDFVPADKLIQKLAAHHPRLLFLSACETAETHSKLNSLAQSLVRSGAQAVLGWAASVYDTEATLFGSHLMEKLADGMELAQAFANARRDLAEHERLEETADGSPRARHWHLARLYFSPAGGGSLATAAGPHRLQGHGQAAKTFLDMKGSQVPVASDLEFVGRRREVQSILREFRAPAATRHAGVLIHGMGRQGKSSLAARIARRMEHSHEVVVIFKHYHAAAILVALRERLGTDEVGKIVEEYLPRVEKDPALLQTALRELLKDCRLPKDDKNCRRRVLLIVDDFEQALEAHTTGTHTVRADLLESIRAIISAFKNADTQSRLLFTSRFEFTLPDAQSKDLAESLHPVSLRGMNDREAQKQALAKLRQQTKRSQKHRKNLPKLEERLSRIMSAAQGNPGLQDVLFNLCLEDPAAFDTCLTQMEAYRATGQQPDADKLRQFLENLAINGLLDLLTPPIRELLRASTLFHVPVPVAVMEALANSPAIGTDTHAIARLVELGLWEAYEDLHDPHERALAVNALVRPLVDDLTEEEQRQHAGTVSLPLFECWGAEDEEESFLRGATQDLELTRLAQLGGQFRVLAGAAAGVLRMLGKQFEYQAAAAWAQQIMAVLDAAGFPASLDLLRTAAERCQRVGLVQEAAQFRSRAMARLEKAEGSGSIHHAATLIDHARALVDQGQPDEAQQLFEQAQKLLPEGREKAIVLGDIARIRAAKGEVDAALALHEERLAVYEALGDKRSRAVTLGDIARIRAAKGEVDAALALHEEMLGIFEALGDKRSRAVTLGDIARIRAAKGEVDAALALHEERLAVYEALGDKRERAVTLGDIARIRADKGEVDAALALHEEKLKIVEALGDKRSRAVTLGDIARLRADKGEVDAALALHEEMLGIFEALGDKRERAVTLGNIARIRAAKGEVDAALALHEERLAVYEALGEKRSRAVTLGDIARIRAAKGEVDAALALHEERLGIFEALGDKRSRAVTLGDIARIRAAKGEVDAALALHKERLGIFEALGDKRSRAVTLGDIARIRRDKGEVDAALALHKEEMAVYEALGDKRSRAVTLGDIARIRRDKGEVDAALALQRERLEVNKGLGDQDGIAAASFDLAQLEVEQEQWQAAFEHLAEAYHIFRQIGRLEGICAVGLDLGQLLCAAGQRELGREILERSLAGFQKLGRQREIQRTQGILARLFGGEAEG